MRSSWRRSRTCCAGIVSRSSGVHWLLAYAIGALAFLAILLTGVRISDLSAEERRRLAIRALRDSLIWPIGLAHLAVCCVVGARELLAELREEQGDK